MKKQIKVFIIFALLLLSVFIIKFYQEYHSMEDLKSKIAKEDAKSLSAFMMAFRQTYQKAFIHNKIHINEETIHLLPVKTTKDIGDTFSQIINNSITIKTISNRPRNPINQANKHELRMINYFKNNKNKEYDFDKHSNDIFHYIHTNRETKLNCFNISSNNFSILFV